MVIPRTCGVSSTPRTVVSITAVSGILDRLPARTNDNGGFSRCRGSLLRIMLTGSLKKERGSRGNAWSQSTRSPCALVASTRQPPPVLGIDRGSVQGFLSLCRARAEDEFVLPPSLGKLMVNPKLAAREEGSLCVVQ